MIDPKFTLQGDKVHPNRQGHSMMAQSLIAYFGDAESAKLESPDKLLEPDQIKAINERMKLYQKAIHAETNPKRPGVPKGGTMESAAEGAKALETRIYGQ
jgi:phospholipase/lecithinase/hemolysin